MKKKVLTMMLAILVALPLFGVAITYACDHGDCFHIDDHGYSHYFYVEGIGKTTIGELVAMVNFGSTLRNMNIELTDGFVVLNFIGPVMCPPGDHLWGGLWVTSEMGGYVRHHATLCGHINMCTTRIPQFTTCRRPGCDQVQARWLEFQVSCLWGR